MKKLIMFIMLLMCNNTFAVCVKNQTSYTLYYEIHNQNRGCSAPKIKFHSGILYPKQMNCHAHSSREGDDWKIYRKDFIQVYKFDKVIADQKELVCSKNVNGILNTLRVNFIEGIDSWWCLDRSDDQD